MDERNRFILILSLICVATAFGSDLYDGSGGSGDGDTTVPPPTTTTTEPPYVEERVTMILKEAGQNDSVVSDLQQSVAKYVELYCADNLEQCVPSTSIMQTIESFAFDQATEDDTAMFLSLGRRLFDKKKTHEVKESHHYRVMQDNITVESRDVVITNETVNGTDLVVEYFVRAQYGSDRVIIPQFAVESTLKEYEENITNEIGFEFEFIPDPIPDGDGDGDTDDDEVLEPWAISLIVVAGVVVLGGIGYFIYKQNATKKKKKKSSAYLDDYTRVNTNTSNSNLYNNTPAQRTSYGSGSSASPSHKYDNPTYDKSDERPDKDDYQDVDLEAGSSEELRTSL